MSERKGGALSERFRQAMSGWVGEGKSEALSERVRRGTSGIAASTKSVTTQCKGQKDSFPSDMSVARHEM